MKPMFLCNVNDNIESNDIIFPEIDAYTEMVVNWMYKDWLYMFSNVNIFSKLCLRV